MKKLNLNDCRVVLTKTGLAATDESMFFYCSNSGEFRRYMSEEEFNSLSANCPLIHFAYIFPELHPTVELPDKWRFLWSWGVADYTSHKPETCFNGGDYAFYERHAIFGRINAGKLELLEVVRHTTSAEFDYDEVSASFQSGLGKVTFMDCEDTDFCLYTQTQRDGFGYIMDKVWSLNQVGRTIPFEDALYGAEYSIDAGYDGDEIYDKWGTKQQLPPIAPEAELKDRRQILKEALGWEPTKRR